MAESEIDEHDTAIGLAHDVAGFDIAMHESLAVDHGQAAADLQTDERGIGGIEAASFTGKGFESMTLYKFEAQRRAVGTLFVTMYGD